LCVAAVLVFLSLLVGSFGVVQQELGTGRVELHVISEVVTRRQDLSTDVGLATSQGGGSESGQQEQSAGETLAGSFHEMPRLWLLLLATDSNDCASLGYEPFNVPSIFPYGAVKEIGRYNQNLRQNRQELTGAGIRAGQFRRP
jgi:hypothetical protein